MKWFMERVDGNCEMGANAMNEIICRQNYCTGIMGEWYEPRIYCQSVTLSGCKHVGIVVVKL